MVGALGGLRRRQCEFGAEDRRQLEGSGRLGEADDAVEAVVVADGERFESESGGLGHQFLRVGRPVEEREVGVAVQFGVGHTSPAADRFGRWPVLPPLAGPGRAVIPVTCPDVDGATRRCPVGERLLDVGPRHVGIVPTHPRTIYKYMFVYQERPDSLRHPALRHSGGEPAPDSDPGPESTSQRSDLRCRWTTHQPPNPIRRSPATALVRGSRGRPDRPL